MKDIYDRVLTWFCEIIDKGCLSWTDVDHQSVFIKASFWWKLDSDSGRITGLNFQKLLNHIFFPQNHFYNWICVYIEDMIFSAVLFFVYFWIHEILWEFFMFKKCVCFLNSTVCFSLKWYWVMGKFRQLQEEDVTGDTNDSQNYLPAPHHRKRPLSQLLPV